MLKDADGNITLSQKKYMRDTLAKFGMLDCAVASSPMEPGCHLELTPSLGSAPPSAPDVQVTTPAEVPTATSEYRALVGSLMYLMISTRPDLAYSVGYLARFMNNHNITHMQAARRVLKYIAGTVELGITYRHGDTSFLRGYSDSDWASDLNTRRSTTGYLFLAAGGAVSWSSRLQQTVALSSTEAEYMALSEAAREAMALRELAKDLHWTSADPILIKEDNQGALAMAYNPVHFAKTKHIHIRHHFIREKVSDHDISIEYIPTDSMLADALTKPLAAPTLTRLRNGFMSY